MHANNSLLTRRMTRNSQRSMSDGESDRDYTDGLLSKEVTPPQFELLPLSPRAKSPTSRALKRKFLLSGEFTDYMRLGIGFGIGYSLMMLALIIFYMSMIYALRLVGTNEGVAAPNCHFGDIENADVKEVELDKNASLAYSTHLFSTFKPNSTLTIRMEDQYGSSYVISGRLEVRSKKDQKDGYSHEIVLDKRYYQITKHQLVQASNELAHLVDPSKEVPVIVVKPKLPPDTGKYA